MSEKVKRVLEGFLAGEQPAGETWLIGLSGGADSVALLRLLREVQAAGCLPAAKLVICHLNHQLRGTESDEDEAFVRRLAHTLSLPIYSERQNVRAFAASRVLSLEAGAREARHAFFARAGKSFSTTTVVLAHHADDQAETVLFNLLRGAGPSGAAGMSPETFLEEPALRVLRPLLSITRLELRQYLSETGQEFREDATNADPEFTRNRLRHRVLPFLEDQMGRPVAPSLRRFAEILRAEDEYLDELTEEVGLAGEDLTLNVYAVNALPLALQRRTMKKWLARQKVPDAGFDLIEEALELCHVSTGKTTANLPGGGRLRRTQMQLWLER